MEGLLIGIGVYLTGWFFLYGVVFAYEQRQYPVSAYRSRWDDFVFAIAFSSIWPITGWIVLPDWRPSTHGFLLWPEKRKMAGRDEQREALLRQMAGLGAWNPVANGFWNQSVTAAGLDRAQLQSPTRTSDEILNGAVQGYQNDIKNARQCISYLAQRIRDIQAALNGQLFPVSLIDNEINTEVRRALLEKFGFEKYMEEAGYQVIARDKYGELIERQLELSAFPHRRESLRAVRVQNSSPEPDGTFKHYILRVPSHMRTPKQAIAWTFGLSEEEYEPEVMT